MAFDVCDQLLEFLKVTSYTCSEYPTPLENLFFLVFFPSIVIIIFVFIVSQSLAGKFGVGKGIRLLISAAAFMFIVLQGLFQIFIPLSKLWLYVAVILFGFGLFFWKHFAGSGGGNGGGGGGGGGGHLQSPRRGNRMFDTITGGMELNPLNHASNRRLIGEDIKRLKLTIRELEDARSAAGSSDEKAKFAEQIAFQKIELKTAEELYRKGRTK